jgi:hypothetical protein
VLEADRCCWFRQFDEHVEGVVEDNGLVGPYHRAPVCVLLVQSRRLQLGDGQATGSNPAGIVLDTNAGFRDRSKVVAWSTVSPCTR